MDAERWLRLSPLLDALLELPEDMRSEHLAALRREDGALADELEKLQDRVPPFPGAEARAIVERAYGRPVTEVFEQFDETPLEAREAD